MRDPRGETVLIKLQGDFFFLQQRPKGQLPEDTFYQLDNLRISIAPSVLEHLKGKRLVEKCYSFGPRHPLTLFFPRYQWHVLTTEAVPGEFIAFEPDGKWCNRPVLEQNEVVLFSFRVLQSQGRIMVAGKLFLTSIRLVFAPDRITVDAAVHGWQAPRESISKVALHPPSHKLRDFLSGAMRTRVAVTTAAGSSSFFRADSPERLQAALTDYIKAEKAEPGAPPNGGPAKPLCNLGAGGGPPSGS
jgi:hypothetical protein